nr:hypothetical protein [Tanacetum cinerariifolium]
MVLLRKMGNRLSGIGWLSLELVKEPSRLCVDQVFNVVALFHEAEAETVYRVQVQGVDQVRQFQLEKPCTKAQATMAFMSGNMIQLIHG